MTICSLLAKLREANLELAFESKDDIDALLKNFFRIEVRA